MNEKSVTIEQDETTDEISRLFDYEFDGTTTFQIPTINSIDKALITEQDFSIGFIVGPSGSGKSTLLNSFGVEETPNWNPKKAIVSHFKDAADAQERLAAVGFNTIPSWMRPYHVLSNGEQFRANLARKLKSNVVIDEFTSVVDRKVAKAASVAIHRYVHENNLKNVVFAGCHYDVIEWLQPDWVYDTMTGEVTTRGSERRPKIILEVEPCSTKLWTFFRNHHYLSGDLNKSSRCWATSWDGELVGFSANLAMPTGNMKKAWIGHRTVILPEFQGMGFGVRMSEAIGEIHLAEGKRYFAKTAHPRLGGYREKSTKWRATTKNKKMRLDYLLDKRNNLKQSVALKQKHAYRITYSHEYIGK